MISTNQFKNGSHIEIDGKIWKIVEFQHVKPGKGGAFVRTKLRRIEDGSVIDKTFRAGEKFRPVRTESKKMQYLYDSGEAAVFMDNRDYEQIEIPTDVVGEAMQWVLPNSEVEVLFVDEQPERRPGAERDRDEGDPDRARASRATPPPAAAASRRRSSRASRSRCRSSSRRARRPGRHPQRRVRLPRLARELTCTHAPIRPTPRRRLRQLPARRHRPPARRADRRRAAAHPRAGRGRRRPSRRARRRDRRPTPRAGRSTGSRRWTST